MFCHFTIEGWGGCDFRHISLLAHILLPPGEPELLNFPTVSSTKVYNGAKCVLFYSVYALISRLKMKQPSDRRSIEAKSLSAHSTTTFTVLGGLQKMKKKLLEKSKFSRAGSLGAVCREWHGFGQGRHSSDSLICPNWSRHWALGGSTGLANLISQVQSLKYTANGRLELFRSGLEACPI